MQGIVFARSNNFTFLYNKFNFLSISSPSSLSLSPSHFALVFLLSFNNDDCNKSEYLRVSQEDLFCYFLLIMPPRLLLFFSQAFITTNAAFTIHNYHSVTTLHHPQQPPVPTSLPLSIFLTHRHRQLTPQYTTTFTASETCHHCNH